MVESSEIPKKGNDETEAGEEKIRYFEWTVDMTQQAQELLSKEGSYTASEMTYKRLEIDARKNWDIFYRQNTTKFYKDRHYLRREFLALAERLDFIKGKGRDSKETVTLLDLGCGVGNAFYPLIEAFGMPPLRVQCCDFAKHAVNFVKENVVYNEEYIDAKCCDLVNESIPFPPQTAQFAVLIFVLSAIAPENFKKVAAKIFYQLPEGAVLYFRDYGRYDLAQLRFAVKGMGNSKLKDNFYVRQDRTRAYYFTLEEVKELFGQFECIESKYCYRVVENRKD